jgi:hypothetical protein
MCQQTGSKSLKADVIFHYAGKRCTQCGNPRDTDHLSICTVVFVTVSMRLIKFNKHRLLFLLLILSIKLVPFN